MEESNEYISDYYYDVNVSSYIDAYGQYFNNSSSEMYLYDYDSIYFEPKEERSLPVVFKWTILALYIIVVIFSVLGNIVTLVAYRRRTIPNSRTNFFIAMISIADIIHMLCEMFMAISNILFRDWAYLSWMCPMIVYPQNVTVNFRAFLLVVLTIDKHFAVWKPVKQNRYHRRYFAKSVSVLTFVVSVLISLPSAMFTRVSNVNLGRSTQALCLEMWTDLGAKYIYSVTMMIMQYFLPILVMGISYAHIIIILYRHRIPGEAIPKRDARLVKSKKQTVRTLIAIVLCYAILWLPLHVITILGALNKSLYDNIVVHIFWMVSQWLTVTTCCVNSIVFFCRNKKYRAFVQDIFKNQTTISLSRAWSTRSQRSRPTKSFSVQMSEN